MIYLEPPGTDPYFNLALEEYVFEQMDRSRAYFMLWQNSNTIVVGKYQNTAEEINPVSYTHLDVYKRQAHRRLGIPQRLRRTGDAPQLHSFQQNLILVKIHNYHSISAYSA